jgi:peptidoglycan/xylan/chitin deacetylase (PgdA/CDA1 family)
VRRIFKKALAAAHPVLRMVRVIGKASGLARSGRLRVLLYHDIDPSHREIFARQLRWLSRRWSFVSPDQFGAMVSGDEPIRGDNLLLTFDDGFASNRQLVDGILGTMEIQALFFVVSDFISVEGKAQCQDFIGGNIFPGMAVEDMPSHWCNMGWDDLEILLERGHTIGGHTSTHARLSGLDSDEALENEIVASADILEKRLGVRINHFAYTFGGLTSFSAQAMAVARSRFRYVYSGIRGDNAKAVSPMALRRDSIAASDSIGLLGAFLEGGADPLYHGKRSVLDQWAGSCTS